MQNNPTSRKKLINVAVFLAMLLIGFGGYSAFMGSKPKVDKKAPEEKRTTVKIMHATKGSVSMKVKGTGIVVPAQKVELQPEVSGTISWISPQFAAGGIIKKGEPILRIDTSDYEIALRKSISTLASAQAELMLEEGQQRVAKESIRLLKSDKSVQDYSTDLALRKPQLMKAEAAIEEAKADVDQAKLNIARCELHAPFDIMVQETNVDLGSRVTTSTLLATLVGIKEYWVETAVPLDRLEYLGLSRDSITAKVVRQGGTSRWKGEVLRLTGSLTESTRLARVVVAVKDPRGLASKDFSMPLMLGDYVDVSIEGNSLSSVYKLPREVVRNENQVWVYENGQLIIKPIQIVWTSKSWVYVSSGITESDAIISSYLSNPYSGMLLNVEKQQAPKPIPEFNSSEQEDGMPPSTKQVVTAE
ncbi:efflux RND transporter periplasmic adaptor subunit [Halodesulfovibrio sp.]|uniref:efflux RND transporter periplasmic adaptor subunit n=1 Tax=Halodesulfovibrio sp. TaxID=1912772 RepID=UPI0025BEC5C2|nr:efflux RND transporter periplasmic adaptor subunit [Halodesulfovibrio sp.]